MLDRLILSAVLGVTGWNGLYPTEPVPTPKTLKQKAKERSISEMCSGKPKSKTAKELCKRWEKQNG